MLLCINLTTYCSSLYQVVANCVGLSFGAECTGGFRACFKQKTTSCCSPNRRNESRDS